MNLPIEILRYIDKYLYVKEVVRLQIAIRQQLRLKHNLHLRWKYEPYSIKGLSSVYKDNCFIVTWKTNNQSIKIYDRKSLTNRQAVRSLGQLVLYSFY